MSIPLLQTKFHVPPPRPHQIARPHLVAALRGGIEEGSELIFVSAPAGFGKTTVLSDWAKESGLPVAWLTLDANDNDADRFLTYLLAAVQQTDERLDDGLLNDLQATCPPTPEALLTSLINQINELAECDGDATDDFIIVLDDYHVISNETVLGAVAFLLEHQPANMHLVIATRSDPPLPLARLRGMGLITELRQRDLRFTEEEAGAFLSEMLGCKPLDEDITVLMSRTEGWAAGLQMAAVSMKDCEDISTVVACFHGSDRYVLDYLLEEVLNRQTPFIQRFLLQTAVLDQMCGPLCDAVVDDVDEWRPGSNGSAQGCACHGAQSILEYLDAANLFIVPLDNERHWYRYHHLFLDLLRQRLQQEYPDLEPILHGRASMWFEQQGMMDLAIDHAVDASDHQQASTLISRAVDKTFLRNETTTIPAWPPESPKQALAEPQATIPTFVGTDPTIPVLLKQAASQGIAPDYAGILPPLPESLSEREQEVLILVATGISNQEIADRLFVAISTVKTHINHIYRKLDVSNRTRAIIRARELGLVEISESTH